MLERPTHYLKAASLRTHYNPRAAILSCRHKPVWHGAGRSISE
jgi:hypothetical protein